MTPLHQWDIARFRVRPQERDFHPGIVVSSEELCASGFAANVNVLACTKRVPGDGVKSFQVVLNGADGLDFQTTVDCRFFFAVPKETLAEVTGRVSYERRRIISRKINEVFRLML